VYTIEYSLDTLEPGGVSEPEFLESIESFTNWLYDIDEVKHVNTITDTLKRLNQNMHGDDQDWSSFGKNMNLGGLHGSHLEGNDSFNSFPSLQSGSWSALMQSAVGETSNSNMDIHDEWSGLAFQKMAPSNENHDTMLNDENMKQKSTWFHNNANTASSLPSHENLETSTVSHSNIEKKTFQLP